MITFEGRQKALRTADIIQRRAHSLYPHISSSKLETRYYEAHGLIKSSFKPLPVFINNPKSKIKEMRDFLAKGNNYLTKIITVMQEKKVGNCFEDAVLAMLIGKLNGQKNVYVGNIIVEKENVEHKRPIDHAVAFITRKKIKISHDYAFKNKEAVIIDPWLNIVDYAGNYFTQIKNNYRVFFNELPNQDFLQYLIGKDSKNKNDFREGRKNSCQHIRFFIHANVEANISKNGIKLLKALYPELVIKKYKKITFPKHKKQNSLNNLMQ